MAKIGTKTGSFAYAKYQLKRSILENALQTNYSTEDFDAALEFFGGCAFCGKKPAPRKDHLVPVFRCGDFIPHNVVPACQQCDDSKGQKDYCEWMRNSNSRSSLKGRGLSDTQVEARIRLIEKWQAGYTPLKERDLFGQDYDRYQDILRRMEQLCEEAKTITSHARARVAKSKRRQPHVSQSTKSPESCADRIRGFILSHYFLPARKKGAKSVTVRSGDVLEQLSLRGQHANVCQAMRGSILLTLGNVKLKSSRGPLAGANTYFTYQL